MEKAPSLSNAPALDDRVADCLLKCPVSLRDLTETFGEGLTWRRLIQTDDAHIQDIPGWGPGKCTALRAFISGNIHFTFEDFLKED